MRLKQLTLHGFKTFAGKSEFHFDGDITAVIGPNGSGKSNVADALRWVLGEQSLSQLRARRSEDLIFAGSTGRGQQGMAEVTLLLDNGDRQLPIDYDEVSITRRAFRSGENEYFINRSRVRLRDVQELLAPVGQSFTVVGQGLADELLSLRPEDRRVLFEEAAGIRPFYVQRDDALKRLARTEENMTRVSDLVSELAPQLRSLERQARHAQEYNIVAGELRDLQDGWYGIQWQAATAALRAAEAAEAVALAQSGMARTAAAAAERAVAAVRREAGTARADLDRLIGEQAELLRRGEAATRTAAVQAAQMAALEAQQAQTLAEHAAGREAVQAAATQLTAQQAAQQTAEDDEQGIRDAAAAADDALRRAADTRRAADRALTAAQERAAAASAHMAGLKQRIAGGQDHRRELERQVAEQGDALAHLSARQATEEIERDQATAAATDAEAAQTAAQTALAQAEQTVITAGQAREATERERRTGAAEMDNLRTRVELARNLSEGGHGLPPAVRAVLTAVAGAERTRKAAAAPDTGLRGIVGVVAGLIQVPQALETAVEVALGGRINDIVVQTWADAEAAIAFLQQSRAGRATFLPLDSLHLSADRGDPLRFLDDRSGIQGLASQLVETAPEYRIVVDQLLGRVIVADSLAVARRVLGRLPAGWNIVTPAGDIVRSGGAVTGGSAAREHGTLARERERRDLEAALTRAGAAQTARVSVAGIAADALARADAARQSAADTLAAARRLVGERSGAAAQLAQRLTQTAQEQTWRAGLLAQAESALREWGERMAAFVDDLARTEAAGAPLAAEIVALTAAATAARKSESVARDDLNLLRTQLAVAEEGARHRRTALQTARAAHARLIDGQRSRAARLDALVGDLAEAGRALDAARAEAAAWEQAGNESGGRVVATQAVLDTVRDRQAAAETAAHAAAAAVLAAESEHGHSLVEWERRQGAADALCARVREDLGFITGDEAPAVFALLDGADPAVQAEFTTTIPPNPWTLWRTQWETKALAGLPATQTADLKTQNSITALRGRLRRMGPINPLAIDEYAAAQARHGFLSSQLADLRAAAESLRQVAADLDRLMRDRLAITFAAVAAAFRETFPRLFGGGAARLELTDPTDMAATGIEVIAQPPGKRAQALNSLSGGERALTSVALLFAILHVRPTPFCIMDEVDAALDEANIGRFRNELAALSARSQFILITHNRATIEAAGAIYGISLGNDTASRILSLRLEELPAAA